MAFQWFLGPAPRVTILGVKGFTVFIGTDIHEAIAFLGFADATKPGGIRCEGTGFLLGYKDHGYLVTARHVAEVFEHTSWILRVNRKSGGSNVLQGDNTEWHFHPDPAVDVAVTEAPLGINRGFDCSYFPPHMLLTDDMRQKEGIGVGDQCYTVALFHFVSGTQHNRPLVHSGNIALVPHKGERIPVGNAKGGTDQVDGYLVESRAISGSSGSPVLVRPSFRLDVNWKDETGKKMYPKLADSMLYILGLFQGAWFLPPDSVQRSVFVGRGHEVVPVGVGVVVPADKIIETLEAPALEKERKKTPPLVAIPTSVSGVLKPDSEGESVPDASLNHLEDFKHLVDVAARKRPQGDQT